MNQNLPPGPKIPKTLQMLHWIRRPFAFMEECAERFGDTFTVRFPGQVPFVFTQDPVAVKEIFSADPDALHSGEANGILRPLLGEQSLLLLDGSKHRRDRQLMTP